MLAYRKLLRHFLEDRFGPLPESVTQRIDSTTDVDRLEVAALGASRLARLEDLRL